MSQFIVKFRKSKSFSVSVLFLYNHNRKLKSRILLYNKSMLMIGKNTNNTSFALSSIVLLRIVSN